MLLVKTTLGRSSVHGIGLFAAQKIARGTVTWEYVPWFDPVFAEADLARMSEAARCQVLRYAYFDRRMQRFVVCLDDQRFINHSNSGCNLLSTPDRDVASRDIEPGEELLCDYDQFDPDYFRRMGMDPEQVREGPGSGEQEA